MRDKATDVIDGWRCLEVAFAAGVKPSEFTDRQPAEAAAIIRSLFTTRDGRGMNDLIAEQRISKPAADQRYTRLRALVGRVLGAA